MTDSHYPVTQVPKDPSAVLELLGSRPPAWEWLYFASCLHEHLASVETKWRDYTLGYSMSLGPQIAKSQLADWASDMMSRATPIARNVEKVISAQAQVAAFGAPGESGDPALIDHMAGRLIGMYEQLLDWADDFRAARLPSGTDERLQEVGVMFVSQPIAAIRAFVSDYVVNLEEALNKLAVGLTEHLEIAMGLVFEIDPAVIKEFNALMKKAVR